jgi:hypothetical protein
MEISTVCWAVGMPVAPGAEGVAVAGTGCSATLRTVHVAAMGFAEIRGAGSATATLWTYNGNYLESLA